MIAKKTGMGGNRMIRALVLRRQAYREHDLLIGALSREEGYLELVARGAKKAGSKLAGHLEPLTVSEMMIIGGRHLDYVASAINSASFLNIKTDLDKLELAGQGISFFFPFLKPQAKDPAIFDFLAGALDILDRLETGSLPIWGGWWLLSFKFRILALSGYQPDFSLACGLCRQALSPDSPLFFNLQSGSLSCQDCANKPEGKDYTLPLSQHALAIFHYLAGDSETIKKLNVSQNTLKEAYRLLDRFKGYII